MQLPASIQNLIDEFSRLPGIGPKTSQRLVFSLLRRPKEQVLSLAQALQEFSQEINICKQCYNFTDNANSAFCSICNDAKRNPALLCVVADSLDLIAMEQSGYNGLYHLLGGTLNPLRGIQAKHLRVQELMHRVLENSLIKEVILAFDPNQEGELTSHHIKELFKETNIKITRLARGLPQGGDLDYADEVTLREALQGRKEI